VRDALLPIFLRLFANERALSWMFDNEVDLETPAMPPARAA
jgi:hypothetical protein